LAVDVRATVGTVTDGTYQEVSFHGDLNGDGFDDAMSRTEGFNIFYGPLAPYETTLSFDAPLTWDDYPCDWIGQNLMIRDQNGDGRDEWLLEDYSDSDGGGDPCDYGDDTWPPTHGAAYILAGPLAEGQNIQTEYTAKLVQGPDADWGYIHYEGEGDLNGDGLGDLLVYEDNRMLTVLGPIEGHLSLDDVADAVWEPTADKASLFSFSRDVTASMIKYSYGDADAWGVLARMLDDWDGDGYGEAVIPTPALDAETVLYVIPGDAPSGTAADVSSTRLVLTRFADKGDVVPQQAADLDHDGNVELLVGLDRWCDTGRVYLVPSPGEGQFYVEDAASVVYGGSAGGGGYGLGLSITGDVDLDKDGTTDVILLDWGDAAYVISGGGL